MGNPNPSKTEREQMAKRIGLHFSQVICEGTLQHV